MKEARFFIIGIILLLSIQIGRAQDPIFSQFYAAPLQLNPAFAGNTYAPFIAVNYRNQWTGFNNYNTYVTYAASFSQFIEGLNSGIGLMVQADDAGDGIYKTSRSSAIYSYRLNFNDQVFAKFGVEGTIAQTRLDWDRLVFPDQIDPTGESSFSSDEIRPDNLNRAVIDFSTGILVYSPVFYAGLSVKHLNTPEQEILTGGTNLSSGLPMRITLHTGAQLPINPARNGQSDMFVAPNLLFAKQGDFRQLNAGAYVGFGAFFAGGWFRHTFGNQDAVIASVGFQKGVMKIGYSYDFTVSELAGAVGSTHEFSLLFNLDANRPRKVDYNDCFKMFR